MMTGHVRIAKTSHERLMQAVNVEFAKFERKEAEFRKREREERAAKLKMPVEKYDTIDRRRMR